jgi:hypothetical protein
MGTIFQWSLRSRTSPRLEENGVIASRKRLKRSLRESSNEVVMITWILSVRQRKEKERFLARRVTVMEDHHNQGRIRT